MIQEEPNTTVRPDQHCVELTQRGKKLPLPSSSHRGLAGRHEGIPSPVEGDLVRKKKARAGGGEGASHSTLQ